MEVWEILQLARIYFCTCVCSYHRERWGPRLPAQSPSRAGKRREWGTMALQSGAMRLPQTPAASCWETRKRSFSITGHCVGIHISANFCRCTKSTGNSLFRYFVLILLKNVRLHTNTSNQTGQCSAVILQAIWSHLLVHRPNGYKACIQMDEIMKNDIVCLYAVYNIYGSFLRELQEKFLEKCPWLDW